MAQLKKEGRWFGMRVTQTIRTENLPHMYTVRLLCKGNGSFRNIYICCTQFYPKIILHFPFQNVRWVFLRAPHLHFFSFFCDNARFPFKTREYIRTTTPTTTAPHPPTQQSPHPTTNSPPLSLFYCHGFGRKKPDSNRGGGGRDRIKQIINLF